MMPKVENYNFYVQPEIKHENNSNNKVQELFKMAEAEEWGKVLSEVLNDPKLVNETVSDGPDAGKTVLWIAAFQALENPKIKSCIPKKAIVFIWELLDKDIELNMDASPKTGSQREVSVMWLLLKLFIIDNHQEIPYKFLEMNWNVNAAPEEGTYQGVSAFSLLLKGLKEYSKNSQIGSILKRDQVILDSASSNITYMLIKQIHKYDKPKKHMEPSEEQEKIQKRYFYHAIKTIENSPDCNVNFLPEHFKFSEEDHIQKDKNAVEMILSLPSSPERNQLLICLIFAGAKPTDTAAKEWVDEYEVIHQKLKTVFQSAYTVSINNLASGHEMNLVPEVRVGIVLNMIWTAFPELQNFSVQRLMEKVLYGFRSSVNKCHLPKVIKCHEEKTIQALLDKAQSGEWELVWSEVNKESSLVNATVPAGPDAGKTLLWIAVFQYVEDPDSILGKKALSFIKKLHASNISINLDAHPIVGPHRGTTVLWHLLKFCVFGKKQADNFHRLFIHNHLSKYTTWSINAAPEEGALKGVTAFYLFLQNPVEATEIFPIVINDQVILDSPTPPSLKGRDKSVIYTLTSLISMYGFNILMLEDECDKALRTAQSKLIHFEQLKEGLEKEVEKGVMHFKRIQNHFYNQAMKTIENSSFCNVNCMPDKSQLHKCDPEMIYASGNLDYIKMLAQNPLEMILSLPSSPDRDKLLVYLIFSDAKPTERCIKARKNEYEAILQKLKTAFQRAYAELSSDLNPEAGQEKALKVIWNAIPELQNFPVQKLIDKVLHGFS